ncbi:MAG: glutamate 5-kinase [Rhodanobacter sp.]
MNALPIQSLPPWRRAVLKIGSSLLAADDGGLTPRFAEPLAAFVASSHATGRQVVLVSSGAVAAGRALLRASAVRGGDLAARQAMAAVGQVSMIGLWQSLSARPVAQVLLTHDDLRNRRRYLNARATLHGLLALQVLPIVNENDTVAVDELKLGDNDNLAAIVAALVDADLLLIASDVDALYSGDPRRDPAATPMVQIDAVTPAVMAMAGGRGSAAGTGGMRTKLEAAQKASAAGIPTAMFDGRNAQTVHALASGQLRGTLVCAPHSRLQARKYWLLNVPAEPGCIHVDAGAALALSKGGASLLPKGVIDAVGEFRRGDMVEIVGDGADGEPFVVARGITQYSAAVINQLARSHTRDIRQRLGYSYGENIVHRDDLVITTDSGVTS